MLESPTEPWKTATYTSKPECEPDYRPCIESFDHLLSNRSTQNEAIEAQVENLNNVFQTAGFRFELQEITRWVDPRGSETHVGESATMNLGRLYRKGGWTDLNIYIIKEFDAPGTAGVRYLPTLFPRHSNVLCNKH
jgi:hypothetical protein